jgi:hypothetical protein
MHTTVITRSKENTAHPVFRKRATALWNDTVMRRLKIQQSLIYLYMTNAISLLLISDF